MYLEYKTNFFYFFLFRSKKYIYFWPGELAEWSNALVLKTSVLQGTESSNLSLSAEKKPSALHLVFLLDTIEARFELDTSKKP